MTPTARTLAELRKLGYTAQVVERWNPHARIRQDLFGCIDVVAIRQDEILGVQATSVSNQANRLQKIRDSEDAQAWLNAGGKLEVWGWGKRKLKRGGKAVRWHVTRTQVN